MSIEEDFETLNDVLGKDVAHGDRRDAALEALGRVVANYRANDSLLEGARDAAMQAVSVLRPLLVVLVAAVLVGCTPVDHLDLDARWKPLKRLQANASTPAGVFQTSSPVILCHAVSDFTSASAVNQTALLMHEQLHALRQTDPKGPGQTYWQALYDTDLKFRWAEESLGWREEIRYAVACGGSVDVELVAGILSGSTYEDPAGHPMISLDAATNWVHDVIAGRK